MNMNCRKLCRLLRATVPARGAAAACRAERRAKRLLEYWLRPRAQEKSQDLPVASVKNCLRHGAFPLRIHRVVKCVQVDPGLLPVIRELRLGGRAEKPPPVCLHFGVSLPPLPVDAL